MNNNNYHTRIPTLLDSKFVFHDAISHALATALASGKNVLLHGPGGHAKSEMIEAALRGLDIWDTTFLASFGEGTTTDDLWGGVNLDAMNLPTGARIQYHPEYSFLAHETAVFEEMLDAPSPVLLDLKDTLTRKELRKGAQRFPMRTRIVIAATNHDPSSYADSDDPSDSARVALLERFPIQVAVCWPSYNAADYLSMFRKHHLYNVVNGNAEKLAELVAEATSQGHFVSPRTAIHALEIVYANSMDRGHQHIEPADLADIKCLAGLGGFGKDLLEDIEVLSRVADSRAAIQGIMRQFAILENDYGNIDDSAVGVLKVSKQLDALKMQMLDIQVDDSLLQERQEAANTIDNLAVAARDRGLALIRT